MKKIKLNQPIDLRAGFTLIEIMLVVVIIGILAGVAAVRFGGQVGKGQTNAAKASIHAISMALSMYELDNGSYPSSLQGLLSPIGNSPNWDGPYIDDPQIPLDPWGIPFKYAYPSSRGEKFFDLKSLGLDGVESADDVTKYN
jgi:general secretion pathway protein G